VAILLSAAAAVPAAAVAVDWAGPTLSLAWDGSTRATAEHSFVGTPVAVPGDRARRALTVRNDGPSGGTLRAWVEQVDLHEAPAARGDGFYDDLRLDWATASASEAASLRALADAGQTLIARTHLAQGESTRIEVGYELPLAATSGNRSVVGAREASFVVRVQISGDTGTAAPPAGDGGAGALARTGLDAVRAGLAAVVGIGAGSLLLGAARRRRDAPDAHARGASPAPR